ncbi:amidase signature domain-containing protein [Aspergillus pseudodeflectus]|uniref:amidase n=1 Tax=Aspergillus pseudodeflectus TaxID=176178 RepID=A0ABR4KG51_9EURO
MRPSSWESKVQAKQAAAATKIPAQWRLPSHILDQLGQDPSGSVLDIPQRCGLLSDRELQITETLDATALLQKLADREYSAVEVTTAFCKRAAIAQQLTSCLTETFFDRSLKRAQELDEYFAKTGQLIGPLHGLPISLKDSFNVAEVPTSIGFVSFLDHPVPSTNSALVDVILAAGAVLYVKTNVPQTMMTGDSHNNIFGRVQNPHRRNLTAGGSSGGEGALVALRGSLLGVGTDIAGSIRIPALCCGIIGFKPTAGRIPFGGQANPGRAGLAGILPSAGPLCHSTRDAELFFRTVLRTSLNVNIDDDILGFPWVEPKLQPVLTIGVLKEDPRYPLHPPMRRSIEAAAVALEAAGHRLVDLADKVPSLADSMGVALRYFQMDPERTPLQNIENSGEPPIPSLRFIYDLEKADPEPTLRELYELNVRRLGIAGHMRRAFQQNCLDVILSVGYQSCAVPHDTYEPPLYTLMWNLVDYPACIIPFNKADEAMDLGMVRSVEYIPQYHPKFVQDAPCHIQLIGQRFRDEALLKCAQVVERILRQ